MTIVGKPDLPARRLPPHPYPYRMGARPCRRRRSGSRLGRQGRQNIRRNPMPHIPPISDDDAGPEQQILFAHSTNMFGRVAHAVRPAAHSPKLAQSLSVFLVAPPSTTSPATPHKPNKTK